MQFFLNKHNTVCGTNPQDLLLSGKQEKNF